ncbi:MAG: 2Fe-2S iron-sulfur cluster-binding protein [Pseudomonadota bacterium]
MGDDTAAMAVNEDILLTVYTRDGEQREVVMHAGHPTLMHALYDEDIEVEASCGGCASCATCHVLIDEAWVERLPSRRPEEDTLLQFQEHFNTRLSRLACQIDAGPELHGLICTVAPEE